MQSVSHLGWETEFIRALRMNLNIVIPSATLAVKISVRIVSRDDFKTVAKSIADLPLELMLIAMSFTLGALSGLSPDYIKRFANQSDSDLFAVVVIIAIFLLSLIINWITRWLYIVYGKLYIALRQYRDLAAQPRLPDSVTPVAITGRILWGLFYCTMMAIMLVSSLGISVLTLAYVLHLIQ